MKIVLLLLFTFTLYADMKQNMFNLYQNTKYAEVCTIGFNNFQKNKSDEEFVSLYAFACLNADYINRLAIPITLLKNSKESRANAAYFAVILMQKELLYHALVDNYDLSKFDLPTTDYILSQVFDLYSKIGKHKPRAFYLFTNPSDKKLTYKLYLSKDSKIAKIVIEEFYNTTLIQHHMYW